MTDRAPAAGAARTRCGFQLPRLPERCSPAPTTTRSPTCCSAGRARTGRAPPDFAEAVDRYRAAARIPQAAYGAMEYYRWAGRSQLRPDGLRYARRMAAPVTAPTLQLHGELDPCLLPSTALGSGRYVAGAYEWRELPRVGHFPQEEAPDEVSRAIADWARDGTAPRRARAERSEACGAGVLHSQAPVATSAPGGCPGGGLLDLPGGERVAGARVVDGRGEDHAEHLAVRPRTAARRSCPSGRCRRARRRRGRRLRCGGSSAR